LSANTLLAVWERHRPEMLERVAAIERAVTALITGDLDAGLLGEARGAAHTLAGTAGTFGYVRASQLAREIERELEDAGVASVPGISRLTLSLRGELEAEAAAAMSAPHVPVESNEDRVRVPLQATRALLVDDDPAALDAMRVLLEGHQFEVFTLADPRCFWETLQEVEPELLLLDLDMPGVNGRELCSVVRGDARWSHLAVIVVTAHSDPETVESLFAAGADDYIAKPLKGSELITRVSNRLGRIRLHRQHAESDGLTGLATRAKASETLGRLLLLGERFSQPVAVAMLDLDRFKAINDTQGHAAGDSVLRGLGRHLAREFRGDDVVGRWGGEEFIAGMYGMAREDGVNRLTGILRRFREEPFQGGQGSFRASFSAGVAQFPLDGRDPDGVLAAADEALYSAKAAGRAQVLAAERREPSEHVDVVCVEDDQALVELLLSTLQTHGYSARAISDGEQARSVLCGSHPVLRCRVLLLDVDLPGLDGHSLLRQFARQGLLGSMRVIMLTARASELETLKTLELGAFDHVAKPFSLPVLIHRVKRAIEG
jgi:diguanylate cyclase (GGDEF)-like protein